MRLRDPHSLVSPSKAILVRPHSRELLGHVSHDAEEFWTEFESVDFAPVACRHAGAPEAFESPDVDGQRVFGQIVTGVKDLGFIDAPCDEPILRLAVAPRLKKAIASGSWSRSLRRMTHFRGVPSNRRMSYSVGRRNPRSRRGVSVTGTSYSQVPTYCPRPARLVILTGSVCRRCAGYGPAPNEPPPRVSM